MILKLKQSPLWLLAVLWLAIISLAVFAVFRPLQARAQTLPPAPTLIWDDNQNSSTKFLKGLTKNNTLVTIIINGSVLPGLKQRSGRRGVASFAVPLPRNLPAGIYEVVATAQSGELISQPSQILELVVPGTILIQGPFVYKS